MIFLLKPVTRQRMVPLLCPGFNTVLCLSYPFLLLLAQQGKLIHLGKVVGIHFHLGILQWLRRKNRVKPISLPQFQRRRIKLPCLTNCHLSNDLVCLHGQDLHDTVSFGSKDYSVLEID
jgi:hypothetical protein